MTLVSAFLEYFKINQFAVYLLCFYAGLSALKYTPLKLSARKWILTAFTAGLICRIAWILFSAHTPHMTWTQNASESDWINRHAIEMTQGIWFETPDGLPAGRRPIGYPLALGLVYKIFGIHLEAAWIFNLFLYAAAFLFLVKMAAMIFEEKGAVLAGFLFAFYPVSIYSVKMITDENLFLPVWYGGLYLIFREVQGKKIPFPIILYGVIFGYSAMIRTHAVFMPAVIGIAYGLMRRGWKKVFLAVIGTFFVMQLINLPWVIRNYRVWGVPVQYVPVSCFMYAQVNSTALAEEGGGRLPGPGDFGYNPKIQAAQAEGKEAQAHQLCNREMKKWILGHPTEFLFLGTRRLFTFMAWNRKGGVWPLWFQYMEGFYDPVRPLAGKTKKILEDWSFSAYYGILFSFLFSGILLARTWTRLEAQKQTGILVLFSCLAFWWAEHMIIYADRKYRYPIEPLMMILALGFLIRVFDFRIIEILRSFFERKKSEKTVTHG